MLLTKLTAVYCQSYEAHNPSVCAKRTCSYCHSLWYIQYVITVQ